MAMYVYKDAARTEKLLAKNAQKQDKGNRYYCPNYSCDAHMHICNIEGVSASYFSASRSYGHIEKCPYEASNGFNPNNYNEGNFEFDNALYDTRSKIIFTKTYVYDTIFEQYITKGTTIE